MWLILLWCCVYGNRRHSMPYHHSHTVRRKGWSVWLSTTNAWIRKRISTALATVLVVEVAQWFPVRTGGSAWNRLGTTVITQTCMGAFKWITFYTPSRTRNSTGDERVNVNFLYNDIVHVLQNTIDSCINSATDRRGYVLERMCLPNLVK